MKLALLIPGLQFHKNFVTRIIQLVAQLQVAGHEINLSLDYIPNIYHVRNKLLGGDFRKGVDQKPFDGADYDKIIFLDSDVIVTYEMIDRLLKHDKDVVSAVYRMENMTQFAVVENMSTDYLMANGTYEYVDVSKLKAWQQTPDTLRKVDYCGMGCIVFNKGVFEKLSYPWFSAVVTNIEKDDLKISDFSSEDAGLCKKLNDAGVEIFVDPAVVAGHQKMLTI